MATPATDALVTTKYLHVKDQHQSRRGCAAIRPRQEAEKLLQWGRVTVGRQEKGIAKESSNGGSKPGTKEANPADKTRVCRCNSA